MPNIELEFINMLFSSINEDMSIRSDIKPCLLGLRVPVIAVSDDQAFFTNPKHPARMTLLLIAKIASGKKLTKEVVIEISKVTDQLIHSSNIKTNSFYKANRKLLKMIESEDKNKVILEYEADEKKQYIKSKKDHIRKLVLTDLNKIIRDKPMPRLARDLTLKVWPHFMTEKCYINGTNNPYWSECIEKYKTIVEYLQPLKNVEQWIDINESYKDFVISISEFLHDSNINPARISASTNNLQKAIAINLNDYKLRNPDLDSYQSVKSKATVSQLKANAMPNHLKPGQWYDIYTTEKSAANRLKLSVILKQENKLIFVDHKGIKGMEKLISVFIDELAHDLSRPVNTKTSLIETWNDLVSRIQSFNR